MKALLFLANILIFSTSFGQIIDPFAIRFQANQKGGIKMLSNVSVGCNCSDHNEMPPSGAGDNNWVNSSYIDIDNDGTTFMSSSDQLNLESCSEITWAGLYWVGRLNSSSPSSTPSYADRNQIKLKIDGGAYINLIADELFDNSIGKVSYYAFKDITALMQDNTINSEYTIGNVVTENGIDAFGGWTIVVVYRNVNESMRNLTIFDGLANVTNGASGTVNIPLSGFLTPQFGSVNFELGVVAHDGDRAQAGDQLQFNGNGTFVNISDPIHVSNNVFNSTISNGGILTPLRNPNYNNTLGHDANIYLPDNSTFSYISNSTSSATIRVTTNSETVLTSVITSAIDIYEPDLSVSVSYEDLNGGTILPGDVLKYTIVTKNVGSDTSINTFLIDTLDQRLTYVAGTIEITHGSNSGIKTDLIDSDQAEFIISDNVIQARIGAGANGIIGGEVINSQDGYDSTVLTFQVKLLDDCPVWQCGETLNNRGYLFGTGQTSGNLNSNGGISIALDANGCPSIETGNVEVDYSACASLAFEYTDSLCVGDSLLFSFTDSQYLDYQWSGPNGFTSNSSNPFIENVQLVNAGIYTLQANYSGENCFNISDAQVFISDNPTIQLNNIVNVDCFNSNTGLIDISVTGNSDLTINWSNNDQDSVANGLSAGTYVVIVTDQYNCSVTDTFNITEPADIVLSESVINPSCQGGTQGSIDLTVTGGVPSYSYLWNNNSTTEDISELYAGQYQVLVTDNNGCQDTLIIVLYDPDALILSELHNDILCYGDSTGVIDISVSNGTPNYNYDWSDGQITEDAINLPYGNYFVNVTDQNNCGAFLSVFLTQPDTLLYLTNSSKLNILCNGNSNGMIDLDVGGGVTPYNYLWDNGETNLDLIDVPMGYYTINITDSNGCVLEYSDSITQPDSLITIETHVNVLCLGDLSGTIDVVTSGGTQPYFYNWNTGVTTEDISGLPIGNYALTTTDSNNCLTTLYVILETELGIDDCVKLEMPNVFTPNNDMINDLFIPLEIQNINSYNLEIENRWGEIIFESDKPNFGWDGTFKERECSEGVYFYRVSYTDNYLRTGIIQGHVSLER